LKSFSFLFFLSNKKNKSIINPNNLHNYQQPTKPRERERALLFNHQTTILDWNETKRRKNSLKERKRKGRDGESVRDGGATGGSEQEHGVVHVSRGLDYLHINIVLFLAYCSLYLCLLSWHGLDHRQSLSLCRTFSPPFHFIYIWLGLAYNFLIRVSFFFLLHS
jgi:hypothetical protein